MYLRIAITITSTFKLTIKEDKSSLKTKDSTLLLDQKLNKADNLVSATDEDGNSIGLDDSRITSNISSIDTSFAEDYDVTYSYKGILKTITSTFKVSVRSEDTKYMVLLRWHICLIISL
jgi:hypothetical protein